METQHISIENRKNFSMTGVTEVESTNDTSVKLNTNMGRLTISGKNLSIGNINLDTGDFSMSGEINKLEYRKNGNSPGKLSSLFH